LYGYLRFVVGEPEAWRWGLGTVPFTTPALFGALAFAPRARPRGLRTTVHFRAYPDGVLLAKGSVVDNAATSR
jgi:hypothetical protein